MSDTDLEVSSIESLEVEPRPDEAEYSGEEEEEGTGLIFIFKFYSKQIINIKYSCIQTVTVNKTSLLYTEKSYIIL